MNNNWNDVQRAARMARLDKLCEHITQAGADGITIAAVRAEFGPTKAIENLLQLSAKLGRIWPRKHWLHGVPVSTYYGAEEWRDAAVKASPPMTKPKAQRTKAELHAEYKKATADRIAYILERVRNAGPAGLRSAVLMETIAQSTVSKMTRELMADGKLWQAYIRIPGNHESRFFASERWMKAAVAEGLKIPKAGKRAKSIPDWYKPAAKTSKAPKVVPGRAITIGRPKSLASASFADQPADYSRAVVTICPAGKDHRFTVKDVTPMFALMAPGSYLPGDSWAARVYG